MSPTARSRSLGRGRESGHHHSYPALAKLERHRRRCAFPLDCPARTSSDTDGPSREVTGSGQPRLNNSRQLWLSNSVGLCLFTTRNKGFSACRRGPGRLRSLRSTTSILQRIRTESRAVLETELLCARPKQLGCRCRTSVRRVAPDKHPNAAVRLKMRPT